MIKVNLDEVQADPRPLDKGIMQSLVEVGQLYPIIAILDDLWHVWDGHTRVRAARELGWAEINVLPAGDEFEAERHAASVTLAANMRANNPLAEAKALEQLDDDDYAMQVAGLSRGEIKSRRRLLNLLPSLQQKLEEGSFALTAAKKLARLPHPEQEEAYGQAVRLMEKHNEERRRKQRKVPTVGEVDQAVRAVKGKMQTALPVPQFERAPSGPDPVRLAAHLRELSRKYPPGEAAWLEKAAQVLDG